MSGFTGGNMVRVNNPFYAHKFTEMFTVGSDLTQTLDGSGPGSLWAHSSAT